MRAALKHLGAQMVPPLHVAAIAAVGLTAATGLVQWAAGDPEGARLAVSAAFLAGVWLIWSAIWTIKRQQDFIASTKATCILPWPRPPYGRLALGMLLVALPTITGSAQETRVQQPTALRADALSR